MSSPAAFLQFKRLLSVRNFHHPPELWKPRSPPAVFIRSLPASLESFDFIWPFRMLNLFALFSPVRTGEYRSL